MTQPLYSQSGMKLSFALLTAKVWLAVNSPPQDFNVGRKVPSHAAFNFSLLSFVIFSRRKPKRSDFQMWLIEKQGKIISASPTHGAIIFYSLIYDEGDVNVSATFCCCSTKNLKGKWQEIFFLRFFPPSLESFFVIASSPPFSLCWWRDNRGNISKHYSDGVKNRRS